MSPHRLEALACVNLISKHLSRFPNATSTLSKVYEEEVCLDDLYEIEVLVLMSCDYRVWREGGVCEQVARVLCNFNVEKSIESVWRETIEAVLASLWVSENDSPISLQTLLVIFTSIWILTHEVPTVSCNLIKQAMNFLHLDVLPELEDPCLILLASLTDLNS